MGTFKDWGQVKKNVLGSTHMVQQLLFSMFPSILTLDFDLILGYFSFMGPDGLVFGSQ